MPNERSKAGVTEAVVDFSLNAKVPLDDGVPRQEVIHAFTDSLGVCLAGGGTAVAGVLDRYLAQRSRTGSADDAASAALLVGALGHALDYDDSVPLMPGHPSVPVLAALLASIPPLPFTGRDFLDAYVIGVEVASQIGRGAGGAHYMHGWHSTSTHGCLGAVAALIRLHELDREAARRAFGIAVSLVSGVQSNFGTMTKPLHAGFAAQHAVLAVDLAAAGATANDTGLEAPQGYFDVYGTDRSRPGDTVTHLGQPWAFAAPGVYLKRYPCCYATHRGIAGIAQIMEETGLGAEDVQSVKCRVPVNGLRPLRHSQPQTGFAGKFSMQYALAAQLVDGDVGLRSFTDEAVQRPLIQDVMGRCDVAETPKCSPDDPEGIHNSAGTRGFVTVAVTTRDGAVHRSQQNTPPGAKENRLGIEEVSTKFLDCCAYVGVDERQAKDLLQTFLDFDDDDNPREPLIAIRDLCGSARRQG